MAYINKLRFGTKTPELALGSSSVKRAFIGNKLVYSTTLDTTIDLTTSNHFSGSFTPSDLSGDLSSYNVSAENGITSGNYIYAGSVCAILPVKTSTTLTFNIERITEATETVSENIVLYVKNSSGNIYRAYVIQVKCHAESSQPGGD